MYARMLDDVLANGIEDMNGILFICFPIVELSAALSRSTMTVKRSLNELEAAGLIVRVRQGFGGAEQDICTHSQNGGLTL